MSLFSSFQTNVKPQSLRKAATHADSLQTGTGTAIDHLDSAHKSVAGQTEGFSFAEELMRVHQSWHGRLGDVRTECGKVSRMLVQTADNYDKNEEETTASLGAKGKSSAPADTSPFG